MDSSSKPGDLKLNHNGVEEALRKSEERYRQIVDNSPDAIITLNKKGTVLSCNPATEKLTDLSKGEIIGRNFTRLGKLTTKQITTFVGMLAKLASGKKIDSFETEGSSYSGKKSLCTVRVNALKDGTFLVIIKDITERKKAEEKLRQSEERLRLFMNSATEGFSLLDSDLNYLMVNDAWLKIRGKERKKVIGKNIKEAIPDVTESGRYVKYEKVLKTGKPFDIDDVVYHTSKGIVHLNLRAFKVGDGLGILTIDITENKKYQDELEKSYLNMHEILEKAPFGLYVVKEDGTIEYVNPKMVSITTYSYDQFMGLNIFERPNLKRLGIVDKIKDVFKGSSFFMGPVEYVSHDRKKFTVRNFVGMPLLQHGEKKALIFIDDITARKKVEEDLSKAYQTMRDILEEAPFGIYLVDANGDIEYVNPAMIKISGDTFDEFKSLNVFKLPTYERFGISKKIRAVLKGKSFSMGPVNYTSHYAKKPTIRNFMGIPLEEYGEKKALIFVEDITQEKGAEKELEKAYKTMRGTLDKAPFGIMVSDKKGKVEYVNPAMLKISGDSYEYIKNINTFKVDTYKKNGIDKGLRKVFKGESFFLGPLDYTSEFSGKRTTRNFMGIPLEEHGEKKALMFVENITKRKKAEEKLEKAYEDLKSLDVVKDEFINASSHALKTPLTSITSFINLLYTEKMGPINDKQKEGLAIMKSESKRLYRLISHILDSSRIDAGKFVVHKQKINLTAMLGDSITSASTAVMNNQDNIRLNSPGIIYAKADPFWLEKVIDNLVHNSIKFTTNGNIKVSVKKVHGGVKVSVSDDGYGISKEHQAQIFDKFYLGERQTATGTGLGLYICKRLIEAHGGTIKVTSKGRNKGAKFSFTLPN